MDEPWMIWAYLQLIGPIEGIKAPGVQPTVALEAINFMPGWKYLADQFQIL